MQKRFESCEIFVVLSYSMVSYTKVSLSNLPLICLGTYNLTAGETLGFFFQRMGMKHVDKRL